MREEEPKHAVQSRYPATVFKWLREQADAQQRSVNWVLNEIVVKAMRQAAQPQPGDPKT